MMRSTERILTTHVGSLVRPPAILEGMKSRVLKQPYDQDQLAGDIRQASGMLCGSRLKSV
jgi:5-methyltetrahydropteroyltriglutamate--homocysteine methyltransferase